MKITTTDTSGGLGGHPFEGYAIPEGTRLAEIRVLSGWYVDSLQLVYADAAGKWTSMEPVGGAGVHFAEQEHRFVLEADEYLVGISGQSGYFVDSIRFHTNKRVSDTYGGNGGETPFSFMAEAGAEVVGFHGRADWYLDAVGALIRPRKVASASVAAAPAAVAPKKAAKKTPAAKKAAAAAAPAPEASVKSVKKAPSVKAEAPASEAPKKTAKKAAASKKASAGKKAAGAEPVEATRAATVEMVVIADDLTVIEGIGPKIAELLGSNDIKTFVALSAMAPGRLREILLSGGRRFAIADPTTWPQQAALAASGDTAGLAALQEKLKGGRKAN